MRIWGSGESKLQFDKRHELKDGAGEPCNLCEFQFWPQAVFQSVSEAVAACTDVQS